jgi:hypothetical protein
LHRIEVLRQPIVFAPIVAVFLMRFLRHLGVLLHDLWAFARANKAWWIVPVVVTLLLVAGLLVLVSGVSPFIYSFF